jgi:Ca2+-binding EF-hand superfamily protein
MSRRIFLCVPLSALLFLFLGLAWSGAAEDPPNKPSDPGSEPDVADLVLLMDQRPILVRLHITMDGTPYVTYWENQLRRLFEFLDRDSDGFLDRDEAKLAPSVNRMQRLLAGDLSFGILNGGNGMVPVVGVYQAATFTDLDTNNDNKVSLDEFIHYYRHTEAGPIEMFAQNTQGQGTNILTDALFAALDTNKDGKLSKEEFMAAEQVLRQFDVNDDELVSAQELLAEAPNRGRAMGTGLFPGNILPGKLFSNIPVMLVPREDAARQTLLRMPAVKELLAQFDKDKRQKVGIDQINFPKELFDKLDTGKNGSLSAKELFRWLVFHPDAELNVRLGRSPGGDRIQVATAENDKVKLPYSPRKTAENSVGMALENIQMAVLRSETQFPQNEAVKAQYVQQFKMLDTKRRGYLKLGDLQQLDKDPNAVTIVALFALANRAANEKLTEQEFNDFLDLMISLYGSQARVTFADNGQSLFEMIDANRDGQLSIRELRTAWKRLEEFDRDKDNCLSRPEIPKQQQLMVSQGAPFVNPNSVAGANFGVTIVQSIPSRGPLWFRKMDVNNDGDVSEREFLGTKEDFKRIDTDGDGLISVEEAEAADAWFRERMRK